MDYQKKSLCYFPTTVLFVDDDPAFLFNIGFEMDSKIAVKTCEKPGDAIKLLEHQFTIQDLFDKSAVYWDEKTSDNIPANWVMKTDIKNLYKEAYNSNRFSLISTLVMDYSMPGLNGAKLCEILRDNPVKKIMLTGAADHPVAVELFNAGLIDHFIVKDNSKMPQQLNLAIHEAKKTYFERASAPLIHSLPKGSSCLNDIAFWHFISHFFDAHHFFEYYIVDESGSVLFIDYVGKPTWIVIKSAKEIEGLWSVAYDNEAPADVIKALEKKEKIPFFFINEDEHVPVSDWVRYLHPAIPLPNLNDYYYAIINDQHSSYCLNQNKLSSYKDYLEKRPVSVA